MEDHKTRKLVDLGHIENVFFVEELKVGGNGARFEKCGTNPKIGRSRLVDIGDPENVARTARTAIEIDGSAFEMAREAAESPLLKAAKVMGSNSALQRLLEEAERQNKLIKAAIGPLDELRRAGVFDAEFAWQRELQRTQEMMADFADRFIVPDISETARLARDFQLGPMAEMLNRYTDQPHGILKDIESMRTPWLDAQRELDSVSRFAEIQGIAGVLERLPTFDEQVSSALRLDIGDWRDQITWPEDVFTDLEARSKFYVGLGFDPSLTDMPAQAFQESLDIAGLRHRPPLLVKKYGAPSPRSDEDEEALERTNIAHDWLLRLETNLRQFIDLRMSLAFGADWPKQHLPKGMYDKWQEKREKAKAAGRESWPLVAYADFTDYELIICKKENWREVFCGYFRRQESVRESLQRLHPIRLDTMHARPIAQDDELLLYVEVKRLIKVVQSD